MAGQDAQAPQSLLVGHSSLGGKGSTGGEFGHLCGTGCGQGFTASPVTGGSHLYFTGEQGDVFVIPATDKFSVVATNQLGGLCLASPAISENTLFFRTTEKLVAVGTKQ